MSLLYSVSKRNTKEVVRLLEDGFDPRDVEDVTLSAYNWCEMSGYQDYLDLFESYLRKIKPKAPKVETLIELE